MESLNDDDATRKEQKGALYLMIPTFYIINVRVAKLLFTSWQILPHEY